MGKRENEYQAHVIKRLKRELPGCEVLKNDPGYQQGMLDLTVLHKDRWATLEVKAYAGAPVQPNQEHYVAKHNSMSFSSFIYPENEDEVIDALQRSLSARRPSRVPKS